MKINRNYPFKRIKRLALMLSISMLLFSSFEIKAEIRTASKSKMELLCNVQNKSNQMLCRLDEIRAIDHSKLSPPERKTLRKELLSMKKKVQSTDGGIYISTGAIIIILLLIIILF